MSTLSDVTDFKRVRLKHNVLFKLKAGAISRVFLTMTLLPMIVKFAFLGALPFVPFVLSSSGSRPMLVGVLLSLFTAGNALGSAIYKPVDPKRLANFFLIDSLILLVGASAMLILMRVYPRSWTIGPAIAVAGYFSARYTIEIRAIRQLLIPRSKMATVVSAQGLLVRVITPLSGIVFGWLLSKELSPVWSIAFAVCTAMLGMMAAVGLFKSYRQNRG